MRHVTKLNHMLKSQVPGLLTSMEYLSKVKKFVLHKGYTEVLSDITAVEEKLEDLFLKEKQFAH